MNKLQCFCIEEKGDQPLLCIVYDTENGNMYPIIDEPWEEEDFTYFGYPWSYSSPDSCIYSEYLDFLASNPIKLWEILK